jgi:type IV secretory pathway protease TraF
MSGKTTSLLATACTLTCFILPGLVFYMVDLTIVYNQSQSLKGGVFMMQHKTNYQPVIGDTVLFYHPKYTSPILKKVSHVEGEKYQPMVGYAISSKDDINQKKTVPKNHIAVQGDHIKSYDSRYASFGFIPLKNIRGKAWRIF